jgi:nanoRNase/pAp phosphatase (c-di-AMP/oligoRNAs hydrolase)
LLLKERRCRGSVIASAEGDIRSEILVLPAEAIVEALNSAEGFGVYSFSLIDDDKVDVVGSFDSDINVTALLAGHDGGAGKVLVKSISMDFLSPR